MILLGGWKHPTEPSDFEEERRLYYVGMTRARKTLTLCELSGSGNPHTQVLRVEGVARIEAGGFVDEPPEQTLKVSYSLLDLSDIWISYAVESEKSRYILQEIAALKPGAAVGFRVSGNRVFMANQNGHKIGALSKAASQQWMDRIQDIEEIRVHSIIKWRKELIEDKYVKETYPESWEVPLPEVVLRDG